MDPIIKKRLQQKIKVHSYTGLVRGTKQYAEPVEVWAYIAHKHKLMENTTGQDWRLYSAVYLEVAKIEKLPPHETLTPVTGGDAIVLGEYVLGSNAPLLGSFILGSTGSIIQAIDVKNGDMLEIEGIGKVTVQTVRIYQGLKKGFQNMEVII